MIRFNSNNKTQLIFVVTILAISLSRTLANETDVKGIRRTFWSEFTIDPAGDERIFPNAILSQTNEQCRNDSLRMTEAFTRNFTAWAYMMWDASARTYNGLAIGSEFQPGSYSECNLVTEPFPAKYCLIDVNIKTLTKKYPSREQMDLVNEDIFEVIHHDETTVGKLHRDHFMWGLCVPKSCAAVDVETYLNGETSKRLLEGYFNESDQTWRNVTINIAVNPIKCVGDDDLLTWDFLDYLFISILFISIVLVVVGTFIQTRDVSKSKVADYFACFSLVTSVTQLYKANQGNDRLQCLYLIRSIGIFYLVYSHTTGVTASLVRASNLHAEQILGSLPETLLTHADLLVDTFFQMSGLLAVYLILGAADNGKLNYWLAVLTRYVRLTPGYAMIVLFYSSVMYKTFDGPLWKFIALDERNYCRKNWWVNLLYVNNYVDSENLCIMQSWYLPCDFHFFIATLVIVAIIRRCRKVEGIIWPILLIIGIAVQFYVTYANKLDPLFYFNDEGLAAPRKSKTLQLFYIKSHTRFPSYLIGMIMGFILYKTKNKEYRLSKWLCAVWMTVGAALMLSAIGTAYDYIPPRYKYDRWTAAVYSALNREIWCVGTALIIFAVAFNESLKSARMLRNKLFVVLAKLSYSIYLVHFVFDLKYTGESEYPITLGVYSSFFRTMAVFSFSVTVAFVVHVLYEAPTQRLMKLIIYGQLPQATPTQSNSHEMTDNKKKLRYDEHLRNLSTTGEKRF